MANFKFNFQAAEIVDETEKKHSFEENEKDWCSTVYEVVAQNDEDFMKEAEKVADTMEIGSCCVRHLTSSSVLCILKALGRNCKYLTSDKEESDLIPGAYEGGFKTWECSIDLAKYLESENCFASKPSVLELGCGSAIPAILAYVQGCEVTFQDFNKEVIGVLTIPNVLLNEKNGDKHDLHNRCLFVAGHWSGIKTKYYSNNDKYKRYNIILTSETIYNKDSQLHLLELMKSALMPKGKIYLASKTHYFGVGGTLDDFISLLEKDGTFSYKTVYNFPHGVQRTIILLQFKDCE